MKSDLVNSLRGRYCAGDPDLLVRKCNSNLVFWDELVEKKRNTVARSENTTASVLIHSVRSNLSGVR